MISDQGIEFVFGLHANDLELGGKERCLPSAKKIKQGRELPLLPDCQTMSWIHRHAALVVSSIA
ncbi:hypothetical protein [Thalassospira alkalitolerans]|uniref:hypothetical protein n=1 Tax=Thalassospira alkalitolerans TaxID=1293890 RepID=UPI003AA862A0